MNSVKTLGEPITTKDYTYKSTYDNSGCVIYKPSNLAFKNSRGCLCVVDHYEKIETMKFTKKHQ